VLALSADGIVVRDIGQMEGLNPGGGNFGPDGRYFVGSRSRSTVMAFAPALDAAAEHFLPAAIVPFPRGFAFGHDGRFFLASGIDPNGVGDNAVVAFDPGERMAPPAGQRPGTQPSGSSDRPQRQRRRIERAPVRRVGCRDDRSRIRRRGRTSCARLLARRLGRTSPAARSALWA
jgi:hypothetical protein